VALIRNRPTHAALLITRIMSKYKDKESGVALMSFNAKWVSWAHTCVAYSQLSYLFTTPSSLLDLYGNVLANYCIALQLRF
jgi:hypothetical protein